nr:GNAT family N-acetyltransferase [uncultured Agathobacter sp.]
MIIIIDEASAKLASFYYHDDSFKPKWKRAVEMTSAPADCIWIVSSKQQKQIADSLGIASVGEPQCGTRYAVESLAELDIEYLERVRRRYNHIPWDIGETDRCLIRELSLSDLPALYELYAKPGMTDYVEPLYDYETELEYQKAYIENMYGFYEYGMWLVFSKETGKLIGRAGLEHDELGYMIAPELQNLGYATEVCRFIIDYARENTDFEELYCRIDERNEASVRLAKKLGFINSGHVDEDIHASIYRKNIKNIKNNEKH